MLDKPLCACGPALMSLACGAADPGALDAQVDDVPSATGVDVAAPTGWPARVSTEPLQFVDIGGTTALTADNSTAGIALVDFDGDGWPDLTTIGTDAVHQFRNLGNGTFEPAPGRVPEGAPVRSGRGLVYGDVDDDGDLDLFVTTFAGDRLFLQGDDGVFRDGTAPAGITGKQMSHGASMSDLDGDGDLDLLVAVEDRDESDHDDYEIVWRNRGDGTFESVATLIGLGGTPHSVTYQMVSYDMNGDGHMDVFVAHDFLPNQVYINRGDGTFVDDSARWTAPEPMGLMGLDVGDVDGDGNLDVYATNWGSDRFFRYDRFGPTYFRSALELALGDAADPTVDPVSWGVALLDLDNDGDLDVFTTASATGRGRDDYFHPPYPLVLENHGFGAQPAMLTDATDTCGPLFSQFIDASSLATGDLDRDGDVDVVLSVEQSALPSIPDWFLENTTQRAVVLQNVSARATSNKSLTLHLRQPGQRNGFAVGARVEVETVSKRTSRVLLAGSSYASASSYALHFGLGTADRAHLVRVTWPDGTAESFPGLTAGEHWLERGGGSRAK